jgi:hypothetical protein
MASPFSRRRSRLRPQDVWSARGHDHTLETERLGVVRGGAICGTGESGVSLAERPEPHPSKSPRGSAISLPFRAIRCSPVEWLTNAQRTLPAARLPVARGGRTAAEVVDSRTIPHSNDGHDPLDRPRDRVGRGLRHDAPNGRRRACRRCAERPPAPGATRSSARPPCAARSRRRASTTCNCPVSVAAEPCAPTRP